MAGRIDQMRQRYEQFSQGDVEGALQDWADDIVWQGSNSTDIPGGGEHSGKDKATQLVQETVAAWDSFELVADEFYEEGDTVVVLGHTNVTKGGESAQIPARPHLAVGGRPDQAAADPDRYASDRSSARDRLIAHG